MTKEPPASTEAPPPTPSPTAARPFLKWAGGKRQLVPELLKKVPADFLRYHEPFLGGGAMFFALRAGGRRFTAYLSDANERLVRTYRAVRDDVDGVVERLRIMEGSHAKSGETFFRVIREEGQRIDKQSDSDVATWMIFLNKACFNGMYRVNKKGAFNVPWGKQAERPILDEVNLLACSVELQSAEIEHRDFRLTSKAARPGDFAYFDPPYLPLSKTSNFSAFTKDGFGLVDHQALRDVVLLLKRRGVGVLLSNSSAPASRELYGSADFETLDVQARRSINSKTSGRGPVAELLVW